MLCLSNVKHTRVVQWSLYEAITTTSRPVRMHSPIPKILKSRLNAVLVEVKYCFNGWFADLSGPVIEML
jgi:hypothetical protein